MSGDEFCLCDANGARHLRSDHASTAAVSGDRPGDELREALLRDELATAMYVAQKKGAFTIGQIADALLPVVTAYAERQARARAAEEAQATALAWQWGAWADAPRTANPIATGQYVTDWLRARAYALTADDQPDPS